MGGPKDGSCRSKGEKAQERPPGKSVAGGGFPFSLFSLNPSEALGLVVLSPMGLAEQREGRRLRQVLPQGSFFSNWGQLLANSLVGVYVSTQAPRELMKAAPVGTSGEKAAVPTSPPSVPLPAAWEGSRLPG